MTNQELLNLAKQLATLNLKGVKVNYAIAKNTDMIKNEFKFLEKTIEPSKEFTEYEQKRLELAHSFSKKNPDGSSIIENNQIIINNTPEFQLEFTKLNTDYATALKDRENQIREYTKLLTEENTDIKLFTISLDSIPEDISTEEMNILFHLIEE